MSTRFNGARLAFVVTALTAIRMADKGELELDAPVTDYLHDLSFGGASADWVAGVNLRRMLSFSSGVLPGDQFSANQPGACTGGPLMPYVTGQSGSETLREFFAKQPAHLWHEPGTQWMYSDWAYSLAARVLEAATGDNEYFADIVRTRFAEPSGLGLTYDPGEAGAGELAVPVESLSTCAVIAPTLGLYLDASDVGKLMQSLATGGGDGVLSSSEVSTLLTGGAMKAAPDANASSFALTTLPATATGESLTVRALESQWASGITIVVPQRSLAFTLLLNGYLGPATQDPIYNTLFERYLPEMVEYDHARALADWADLDGTYHQDDGTPATVHVDVATGKMTLALGHEYPMKPSSFEAWYRLGRLWHSVDEDIFALPVNSNGANLVRFYREKDGGVTLGFLQGALDPDVFWPLGAVTKPYHKDPPQP